MSGPRFTTLRDLFVSFPTAETEIGEDAVDQETVPFIRRCGPEGRPEAALTCCAYLLSRREAVWWACNSLAGIGGATAAEAECLSLARQWVARPEEAQRRRALDRALETNSKLPGTWVALAAGWSGGSIAPPSAPPLPPSPAATPQAVRVALLSAVPRVASAQRPAMMTAWIDLALLYINKGVDFR